MRLPSGQPSLQNGMPQSMQRAAWTVRWSGGNGSYTSFQSRSRTGTGRRDGSSRPNSINPVGLPMSGGHDGLVDRDALFGGAAGRFHRPLVVPGDALHELGLVVRPAAEDAPADRRAGLLDVAAEEARQPGPAVAVP